MKLFLYSILMILSAGFSASELPDVATFQRQLSEKLVKVTTIQSAFVQTREMPALELKLEFTGRLTYDATSKRLLWRVDTPLKCAFRMQKGELTQWDGETGKTLTLPASKLPWIQLLQERLGQWLSGDLPALREEAEISMLAANRVRLTPTGGMLALLAKGVEIEFAEDLSRVVQIRLEETGGDLLYILFKETRLNQPIPEEAWKLD